MSAQAIYIEHDGFPVADHPSWSLSLSGRLYSLLLQDISPWVPVDGTKQLTVLKQRKASGGGEDVPRDKMEDTTENELALVKAEPSEEQK